MIWRLFARSSFLLAIHVTKATVIHTAKRSGTESRDEFKTNHHEDVKALSVM